MTRTSVIASSLGRLHTRRDGDAPMDRDAPRRVIAGNGAASGGKWRGVAPGAPLVSVKVAGPDGATDVSVVIAALQWVVTHRAQYGIKVLNLSFGTDSVQPYASIPERRRGARWAAGITVVVSSGNRAPGRSTTRRPYVITVGAPTSSNGRPQG